MISNDTASGCAIHSVSSSSLRTCEVLKMLLFNVVYLSFSSFRCIALHASDIVKLFNSSTNRHHDTYEYIRYLYVWIEMKTNINTTVMLFNFIYILHRVFYTLRRIINELVCRLHVEWRYGMNMCMRSCTLYDPWPLSVCSDAFTNYYCFICDCIVVRDGFLLHKIWVWMIFCQSETIYKFKWASGFLVEKLLNAAVGCLMSHLPMRDFIPEWANANSFLSMLNR